MEILEEEAGKRSDDNKLSPWNPRPLPSPIEVENRAVFRNSMLFPSLFKISGNLNPSRLYLIRVHLIILPVYYFLAPHHAYLTQVVQSRPVSNVELYMCRI